jgi:hypothetical protein
LPTKQSPNTSSPSPSPNTYSRSRSSSGGDHRITPTRLSRPRRCLKTRWQHQKYHLRLRKPSYTISGNIFKKPQLQRRRSPHPLTKASKRSNYLTISFHHHNNLLRLHMCLEPSPNKIQEAAITASEVTTPALTKAGQRYRYSLRHGQQHNHILHLRITFFRLLRKHIRDAAAAAAEVTIPARAKAGKQ